MLFFRAVPIRGGFFFGRRRVHGAPEDSVPRRAAGRNRHSRQRADDGYPKRRTEDRGQQAEAGTAGNRRTAIAGNRLTAGTASGGHQAAEEKGQQTANRKQLGTAGIASGGRQAAEDRGQQAAEDTAGNRQRVLLAAGNRET